MNDKLKLTGADTPLKVSVEETINEHADDYDDGAKGYLGDLMQGGCQSGIVGPLIYRCDAVAFFEKHKLEINELIKEMTESTGSNISELLRDFDQSDPLCLGTPNQNLLAWFGFEETARSLASNNGIEL